MLIVVFDAIGVGPDTADRVPGFIAMMPAWGFASCLGGTAIGGLMGLIVGLVDGPALGIIAAWVPGFRGGEVRARGRLRAVSAVISGLTAFLLFVMTGASRLDSSGEKLSDWVEGGVSVVRFVWVVLPALVAAGYGWWVGNRVASWIEHPAGFPPGRFRLL
jgi:hypothetical protein